MFRSVEMPLWVLVLLVGFAAVTFASHFLFPSVRWFFRRRLERAVAELNKRLERPIQPFKLARRHDMIQRLIYDPQVHRAILDHASAEGVPENVAFERARRYAREIVPSFSASTYFGFAIRAARLLSTSLYRVRLGHFDEDGLKEIDPEATVVFVINHRSNMDYVLVTYLAAERSALSYAVGEWAQVWPLSGLIRAMGAYFIRRKKRSPLYTQVLSRYVRLATEAGVTQAVFPEGGLSLTGALGPPKLGLLSYMIEGHDLDERDVVFVPVALNYDRVLEDQILIAADRAGRRQFRASVFEAARFVARLVWLRLRGRYQRFGYAAVSFGAPVSLRAQGGNLRQLGRELNQRIGQIVPVLPVPLVARALLEGPCDLAALQARVRQAMETLPNAHVHIPRDDLGYTIENGLRNLRRRGAVTEDAAGLLHVPAEHLALVRYYAASIAHLAPDAASAPETPPEVADLSAPAGL